MSSSENNRSLGTDVEGSVVPHETPVGRDVSCLSTRRSATQTAVCSAAPGTDEPALQPCRRQQLWLLWAPPVCRPCDTISCITPNSFTALEADRRRVYSNRSACDLFAAQLRVGGGGIVSACYCPLYQFTLQIPISIRLELNRFGRIGFQFRVRTRIRTISRERRLHQA